MFAEQYTRNDTGWILFPQDDTRYRRDVFPDGWQEHHAKANMFLIEELIKHTTKPGDLILDPFGGTGTIFIGLRMSRRVVTVDIEDPFCDYMETARKHIMDGLENPPLGIILRGNCRNVLPLPVDAVITSPPYADVMAKGGGILRREVRFRRQLDTYSASEGNIGRLKRFWYNRAMRDVYTKCAQSLKSGSLMSIIIKDKIEKGKRVSLAMDCVRICQQVGFALDEWHKWLPRGHMFVNIKKSRGERVIEDEDILLFRRI